MQLLTKFILYFLRYNSNTMDENKINDDVFFKPAIFNLKKNQFLLVSFVMILCALVGFIGSFLIKPNYEAKSVLVTNFELVEGANITELMVFSQLEIVRQIMLHPDITDEVIRLEQEAGNEISLDELKQMSVIEGRLNSTIVKIRSAEPEVAARIATNWVEVAYERLSEAYEHALLVSEAKWVLTSSEKCLTDEKVFDTAFCETLSLDSLEKQTEEAQAVILAEGPKSLGLTKEIQISQFQPASIPTKPIQGSRANFMLIGALAGLVLSMIALEMPRNSKKVN